LEEKEYKRFTVSLPPELYEQFEEFRKKLDISRSDCIRKAMNSYMISEENIQLSSEEVVGCITMIIAHEHFDPSHQHPHDHPDTHENEHNHANTDEHTHDQYHEHDFSSRPVYANVSQTDLILNNDIQHHFVDIIKSTMHIHLEFKKCLEIIAVSGPLKRVRDLKEALQRLKSVLSISFYVVDKK